MSIDSKKPYPLGPALGIVVLGLGSLAMIARLVGCSGASTTGPDSRQTATSQSRSEEQPAKLLRRVIEKYQQAEAYGDQGRMTLSFVRNGRIVEQPPWNAAVQFFRPGRLRVEAFNLKLASDATADEPLLRAQVTDEESNNIDNQFVSRRAPQKITLEDLASDTILYSQLTGRIQGPPVQLELLLSPQPLETLFSKDVKLLWRDDASIDKHSCRRIEAATPQGSFVFWIDEEELLLRRVEYPAKELLPDLAGDPQITEASLVADMTDATCSPNSEQTVFALDIPEDAKLVRAFVLPPVLSHADLLGKKLPYEFVQLDGQRVTPDAKQVTALFWYAHHPVCEKPAHEFAAAARRLKDHIRGVAICTEPPEVGDKAVRTQLAQWKTDLTPARDLQDFRSRVFEISQLPSVTLLDEEGRFQWMASGPTAIADLVVAVNRLLNGENLAQLARTNHEQLRRQYERLIAAGGPSLDDVIAPPSEPQRLKLKVKWGIGCPQPVGSLTVDPREGKQKERLLSVVGSRSVWEIAPDGAVDAKYELDLPEDVEVSSLRVFREGEQCYFAAFAPLKKGIHVFDEDWKRLFSYPTDGDDALAVRDAQIADLDNDGQPELLVALTENAGLHAVSMEGKRLWSSQAYVPLLSVAVSHEAEDLGQVAYVTGRGGICALYERGNDPPVDLSGWVLAHLFTARFPKASQAAYLGIGANADGEPCAIGINPLLQEMWNYPLNGSLFQQPVDFIASGKLRSNSRGEWIIGWGDGSIHVVAEDDEFDDTFHTGHEIRGVAALQSDEGPLLVVSTPTGLTAWTVSE